jgi:MoaA/NifB/PqqE/SkfB family radical SAM enzyme
MCDIWKANNAKREISVETLAEHISAFKKVRVREVVLSGGEALMHSNLWKFCQLLRENNVRVTLLSTGLLLKKHAAEIVRHISNVIVSLDGTQAVHDRIRNTPNGFAKLVEGIRTLKSIRPDFRVTGRCVLQRFNFQDLIDIVISARAIGLDQISFLAADVSTTAFNHPLPWTEARLEDVALSAAETARFEAIVAQSFIDLEQEYHSGFIAESMPRMKNIVQYYKAVNGMTDYPRVVCNAPWVSAVIESDGSVLPCFFHKPYGNIYSSDFLEVVNTPGAREFRRNLDVNKNEICRKCVCSLKLGLHQMR